MYCISIQLHKFGKTSKKDMDILLDLNFILLSNTSKSFHKEKVVKQSINGDLKNNYYPV